MTSSEKLFPKNHQPIPIRDEQSELPQIIPYLTEDPEEKARYLRYLDRLEALYGTGK